MQQPFPHVDGVSHRFVNANGVRLHVAEAGGGEPLLMLHGWPQHWYMWRHQIPDVAQRYSVICPDLRGFGWSDAPAAGYEKERLVDDVIALLDALDLKRVRLMGHDWGGWIGFLLCLRHPDRVERFLALNIPHPFQKSGVRLGSMWRLSYQGVLASPGFGEWFLRTQPAVVRALVRHALVKHPLNDDQIAIFTDRIREPARARASVLLYRTFLLHELLPVLRGRYCAFRLTTPTKILFGTRDVVLTTDMLKGADAYADDLEVELVATGGHFIAEDEPELVTARALEFFGRANGPSQPAV